jgi:nuclear pore complex protein Nup85
MSESFQKNTFIFNSGTNSNQNSDGSNIDNKNSGNSEFSFGKPTSSPFTFGNSSNDLMKNDNPIFSFTNNKTEITDSKSAFSFGDNNIGKDTTKSSSFGLNSQQDKIGNENLDNGLNGNNFSFGLNTGDFNKSTSGFNGSKSDTEPTFKFNNSLNDNSKIHLEADSHYKEEISKPSFGFSTSQKDLKPSSSEKNQEVEIKTDLSGNKQSDDQFLKNYQAPSVDHLIQNSEMEICQNNNDNNNNNNNNNSDDDDDEFFDVDIDEKTNLPIRKLEFEDNTKSLLSNKNEHLNFSISNKTERGMLFVDKLDENKNNIEKNNNDNNKTNNRNKNKNKNKNTNTNLYQFDLLPQLDSSLEYKEFLNNIYKEFEPLLKDKKYKHYLQGEDDEYMEIGVISNLEEIKRERKLFLSKLMSFILINLQNLISEKIKKDYGEFSDQWVVNFEQIISVLYLMNAIYFGNDDETIILFQQWIERIDIQPDESLLENVFKESDKPYQSSLFWSVYVKKFLLRGGFFNLIEDFKVSQYEELKEIDNELFNIIEDFLQLISTYDPIKFSYDISSFLKWKKNAVELREFSKNINVKNVIIHGEILELLNIISGSSKTIENSATTWYECFMGFFLYQMPSKKLINEYIEKSLSLDTYEKPIQGIETWDSICIELFKGKYLTVIASIESLDKSIGTFIAILIESSGLLENYSKNIPNEDLIIKRQTINGISNNIDRMIEDLALTYLNEQELFAIGVGILINIGSNKSREILSELLPTYEIKDSDDFEWVLSICSKLKLDKTMSTIQQIQGEKFYEKQLIPNALNCFAKSNSNDKLISIIWRLFEDILLNEGLDYNLSIQLFENNISEKNAILRQSLSPLYILNEIIKRDAIKDDIWYKRLIELFEFKYLPEYYKVGLILLIFDNLNHNIFSLDNLVNIISKINDFENQLSKDNNDDIKNKSNTMYMLLVKSRADNGKQHYPNTYAELIHAVRRGIAMDVSFAFLEDGQY